MDNIEILNDRIKLCCDHVKLVNDMLKETMLQIFEVRKEMNVIDFNAKLANAKLDALGQLHGVDFNKKPATANAA